MSVPTQPDSNGSVAVESTDRRTFMKGVGTAAVVAGGGASMAPTVSAETTTTPTPTPTSRSALVSSGGSIAARIVSLFSGESETVKDTTKDGRQQAANLDVSQSYGREREKLRNDREAFGYSEARDNDSWVSPPDSNFSFRVVTQMDSVIANGLLNNQSADQIKEDTRAKFVEIATDVEKDLLNGWNRARDVEWYHRHLGWKWIQDEDESDPFGSILEFVETFGVYGADSATDIHGESEPMPADIRPTYTHTLPNGEDMEVIIGLYQYEDGSGGVDFGGEFIYPTSYGSDDRYYLNSTQPTSNDTDLDYTVNIDGSDQTPPYAAVQSMSVATGYTGTDLVEDMIDFNQTMATYHYVRKFLDKTLNDLNAKVDTYVEKVWEAYDAGEITTTELMNYQQQAEQANSDLGAVALRLQMLGFGGDLTTSVDVTINRNDDDDDDETTEQASGSLFLDIPESGGFDRPVTNIYDGDGVALSSNDYTIQQIRNMDGYDGSVPVTVDLHVVKSDDTSQTYSDIQTTVSTSDTGDFVVPVSQYVDSVESDDLSLQVDGFVTIKKIGDGEFINHFVDSDTTIVFGSLPDSLNQEDMSSGEENYVVADNARILSTSDGEYTEYGVGGDDTIDVDTVYMPDGSGTGHELEYRTRLTRSTDRDATQWERAAEEEAKQDSIREKNTTVENNISIWPEELDAEDTFGLFPGLDDIAGSVKNTAVVLGVSALGAAGLFGLLNGGDSE